jgi:DNA polymerase III subunit delta
VSPPLSPVVLDEMTEPKAHLVDQALQGSLDRFAVILVHGPDTGLVAERARQAAQRSGVPLNDPFLCIRAEADEMLSEPGRLMDEALSISMFGGKRLIWLRLGARNAAPAVEALLAAPALEAVVVLEAGELRSGHVLRSLCEKAPNALSIVCYADESESVERIVTETIRSAGKTIDPSALDLLTGSLGADRALTRNEVDKLLLYSGDDLHLEVAHVEASVIDAAKIEPSAAIDAAFGGALADVEPSARRVLDDGLDAGALLGMGYRHGQALLAILRARNDGLATKDAAKRQGIHFRREAQVARQAALWSESRLLLGLGQLSQGVAECRKNNTLASSIAIRCLWGLALAARKVG